MTLRLSIFSALLLSGPVHAEVLLEDTYAPESAGGAPTQLDGGAGPFGYELSIDAGEFSAAGHGKLIMVYSSKDENGPDLGGAPVTGVSYGGVPLEVAYFSANDFDRVTVGIFYLDNVSRDGVLRIELEDGGQTEYGFGLYAVDGLKEGPPTVAEGRTVTEEATVTLATETGFLVQEAARNNQSLGDDPDDDYETLYYYDGPQSYRALSQYQVATSAGDYLAPINNGGVNFRLTVGAAFEGGGVLPGRLKMMSLERVGPNLWELTMTGRPNTDHQFVSAGDLDFENGTLLENLVQGSPGDAGSIGGANRSVLTTDENGMGKARVVLTGEFADFLRAETVDTL